jgi:SAM-dependent methyltransferase
LYPIADSEITNCVLQHTGGLHLIARIFRPLSSGLSRGRWNTNTLSRWSFIELRGPFRRFNEKLSEIMHSCAAFGMTETFKALTRYVLHSKIYDSIDDSDFDKKFHTNTAARIDHGDLNIPDPNAQRSATIYRTAPERFIRFLIENLDIDFPEYDFVDIGCGKGRVLLVASSYPFRSIRGIELSRPAYIVAEHNLKIYRSVEQECFDIEIYNLDARNFEPNMTNTVYYFFEPFQFPTLVAVLARISSKLKGQGKSTKIICVWADLTPALPFIDKLGFEMICHRKMVTDVLHYAVFSLRPM